MYYTTIETKQRDIKMKLLGKGAFTKAYQMDNGRVFLKSVCRAKECMSMGWFPDCSLFPIVESGEEQGTYEMDYLTRVKAPSKQLNKRSLALYKALSKLANTFLMNSYEGCLKAFNDVMLTEHFKEEANLLLEALDALTSYGGDICFEISPRNISVDAEGNLILADCFFFMNQLRKVRR